jgi:hypothetical protein
MLLECKNPLTQKSGEYVLLQAGGSVWNTLENISIEDINTAVDHAGLGDPHFFTETNNAIFLLYMDGPIPACV